MTICLSRIRWQTAFKDNEIDGEALKLMKDPSVLDDMGIPKPVASLFMMM
jgi:hypothetical protein